MAQAPEPLKEEQPAVLSSTERWNISCMLVAWSCVVSSMTIVVGNSSVLVQAVGGSSAISPFGLGTFFVGMSSVSLLLTHWVFQRWGRKVGFGVGIGLGFVGSIIGAIGVLESSPFIVILAMAPLGAGAGIGMYLRFASMEVVPPVFHAKAVTWVLLGGCFAAFLGPELAQASTKVDWSQIGYSDQPTDGLEFVGVFVVTATFNIIQAVFIAMVSFPVHDDTESVAEDAQSRLQQSVSENAEQQSTINQTRTCDDITSNRGGGSASDIQSANGPTLAFVLSRSSFWLPMLIAGLVWAIMAMPMGIVRVVMNELGYSSRQSLLVMEFHFLSMYSPGLVSGTFIGRNGPQRACWVSCGTFLLATIANLTAQDDRSKVVHILPFAIGLALLGIGWNFGFSASTVWVSQLYQPNKIAPTQQHQQPPQRDDSMEADIEEDSATSDKPHGRTNTSTESSGGIEAIKEISGDLEDAPAYQLAVAQYKPQIQAANEFGMFLLSGSMMFSTGYIYRGGGSGIEGWRTLQIVIFALLGTMVSLLIFAMRQQHQKRLRQERPAQSHNMTLETAGSKL